MGIICVVLSFGGSTFTSRLTRSPPFRTCSCKTLTAIHHYLVSTRKVRRRITRRSDNRSFTVRISACLAQFHLALVRLMLTRVSLISCVPFITVRRFPSTSQLRIFGCLLLGVLSQSNGGAYVLLRAAAASATFWELRRSAISEPGGFGCGPTHPSMKGMISEHDSYQLCKRTSGTERK